MWSTMPGTERHSVKSCFPCCYYYWRESTEVGPGSCPHFLRRRMPPWAMTGESGLWVLHLGSRTQPVQLVMSCSLQPHWGGAGLDWLGEVGKRIDSEFSFPVKVCKLKTFTAVCREEAVWGEVCECLHLWMKHDLEPRLLQTSSPGRTWAL